MNNDILEDWKKLQMYFGLQAVPLRIKKTSSQPYVTGSAVTEDYIKRSKRKTRPYTNITIPEKIPATRERIRHVLTHEALHHKGMEHSKESRKKGFNHLLDKDTYGFNEMLKVFQNL